MTNHRNKQNYRFRTWKFRDRCHLKCEVRQGCFLSLILNYLMQYIHYHSLYIMSHYYAKFKENPCVGTDASTPFKYIGATKVCSNVPSYTTKMVIMPIYSKTPSKIVCGTKNKDDLGHWYVTLGRFKIVSNDVLIIVVL